MRITPDSRIIKGEIARRGLPFFYHRLTGNQPSCNHLREVRSYSEDMSWILVVEDEDDISSFLRFVLENEDYKVVTVGTIADARERLTTLGAPMAVLLDRGLPDGDGLEICRELKACGKRPPVIVLSARKLPGEIAEGRLAGADEYIVKPFEFMSVLERVRALSS